MEWVGQSQRQRLVASRAEVRVLLKWVSVSLVCASQGHDCTPLQLGLRALHPLRTRGWGPEGPGRVHTHELKGEGDGCRCPEAGEDSVDQVNQAGVLREVTTGPPLKIKCSLPREGTA